MNTYDQRFGNLQPAVEPGQTQLNQKRFFHSQPQQTNADRTFMDMASHMAMNRQPQGYFRNMQSPYFKYLQNQNPANINKGVPSGAPGGYGPAGMQRPPIFQQMPEQVRMNPIDEFRRGMQGSQQRQTQNQAAFKRDPNILANYWANNPGSMERAMVANPRAWGLLGG